ncbi:MAG: hypothetical protein J0I41_22150 [Filimonas sp.]|nr:hypothetical protein [Filimonas sp.]
MMHYEHWEHCKKLIEEDKIAYARDYATEIAIKLGVSKELIDKIMSVNLKSYENRINNKMSTCISRAKTENSVALCLYYDMDNGWESTMYICKSYAHDNNYWITASRSWVDIGRARGFSGFYKNDAEAAFFCDNTSAGICLLLMLQTTVAFYNVAKAYRNCGLIICITATENDFVRVA